MDHPRFDAIDGESGNDSLTDKDAVAMATARKIVLFIFGLAASIYRTVTFSNYKINFASIEQRQFTNINIRSWRVGCVTL